MITLFHPRRLVLALIAVPALTVSVGVSPGQDRAVSPAITLIVDETQAARRIAFVHLAPSHWRIRVGFRANTGRPVPFNNSPRYGYVRVV